MKGNRLKIRVAVASVVILAGCATDDSGRGAFNRSGMETGAVLGAAGGALLGAVAYGTSAIVLAPALVAAFLTFYGGFIILFLVACAGLVVSAAPMAPRPPGTLPSAGRR